MTIAEGQGRKLDTDLAGIRDPAELSKHPQAEQKASLSFWAEVDDTIGRIN